MLKQLQIFPGDELSVLAPPQGQLLKWIGNKQRYARQIVSFFPAKFGAYFEPFLGSGAILATLAPSNAFASDIFPPLMEIWTALKISPNVLKEWYSERWIGQVNGNKKTNFEKIKASYNTRPNGADLLFICRACYGGVVRFRKCDGYISTPCGIHDPIPPEKFNVRVDEWHERIKHVRFETADYQKTMEKAKAGDLIYCDPPYSHSQTILYGAQSFRLEALFDLAQHCKKRGVFVAISIDGTKSSGKQNCELPIPEDLFEREVFINCGPSMLKRFQMDGMSLEEHHVSDRLLLTF